MTNSTIISPARSILVSFFLANANGSGGRITHATMDGVPSLTSRDVKDGIIPNLANKLNVEASQIHLIAISMLDNPTL